MCRISIKAGGVLLISWGAPLSIPAHYHSGHGVFVTGFQVADRTGSNCGLWHGRCHWGQGHWGAARRLANRDAPTSEIATTGGRCVPANYLQRPDFRRENRTESGSWARKPNRIRFLGAETEQGLAPGRRSRTKASLQTLETEPNPDSPWP